MIFGSGTFVDRDDMGIRESSPKVTKTVRMPISVWHKHLAPNCKSATEATNKCSQRWKWDGKIEGINHVFKVEENKNITILMTFEF